MHTVDILCSTDISLQTRPQGKGEKTQSHFNASNGIRLACHPWLLEDDQVWKAAESYQLSAHTTRPCHEQSRDRLCHSRACARQHSQGGRWKPRGTFLNHLAKHDHHRHRAQRCHRVDHVQRWSRRSHGQSSQRPPFHLSQICPQLLLLQCSVPMELAIGTVMLHAHW